MSRTNDPQTMVPPHFKVRDSTLKQENLSIKKFIALTVPCQHDFDAVMCLDWYLSYRYTELFVSSYLSLHHGVDTVIDV